MSQSLSNPSGSTDFSFNRFARQPFYEEENARFVNLVGLKPGLHVVDLACGPGAITKLILERIHGARESLVIGVDLSAQALQQARQDFANVRDAVVQFIEARAEDLSKVVRQRVDAVVLCNAIHLMPNKAEIMREVGRTLKPGGVFAFNTAFYQGTQLPETETFYRRWMMRAIRSVRNDYHLELDKSQRPMARQQITPDEYRRLLAAEGFRVSKEQVEIVQVPLEGWLDICAFADFVEGALPGVPVDTGSDVLRKTVTQTFEEMKLTTVPRNWLEVIAVRA